jgi:hypothetical protein
MMDIDILVAGIWMHYAILDIISEPCRGLDVKGLNIQMNFHVARECQKIYRLQHDGPLIPNLSYILLYLASLDCHCVSVWSILWSISLCSRLHVVARAVHTAEPALDLLNHAESETHYRKGIVYVLCPCYPIFSSTVRTLRRRVWGLKDLL